MHPLSLGKDKIKILLLEGVDLSAVETLKRAGYTNVEYQKKALDGQELLDKIENVHFLGIRSRTFLTKEVCSALDAESFETYLGFLHGIRYGRKSLALDVMEEFRQPVADRLVMLLFNKRIIGKYDFDFPESGGVILNEDGFRKFCVEYEKWMDGRNTASGEKSFRNIIRRQTAELKRSILQKENYVPYRWKEE